MRSAFFWRITQRRMVILHWRLGTTYRSHIQESKSPRRVYSSWTFWPLKMGPIRCPETSVKNYHSTLRNTPEERKSQSWLVSSSFQVMEHRWNETDREKAKCSRKNLSQSHSVRHKCHMDWPGIEPGPPHRLSHGRALAAPCSAHCYSSESSCLCVNLCRGWGSPAVLLEINVYWNVTLGYWPSGSRRFERSYLHLPRHMPSGLSCGSTVCSKPQKPAAPTSKAVVPNLRRRPTCGSQRVWRRAATGFYGELDNYGKK
jgi:hypothetical protein